MNTISDKLKQVHERIHHAEKQYGRPHGSVQLLAVSKTRPAEDIATAAASGQRCFGESYLQEAQEKIAALSDKGLEWHFIGPIQSNKTRPIAELFQWVHSVDRLKIAQRLNEQRPAHLPPLNICLQVNISGEGSKSGMLLEELPAVARALQELPRLRLRGLMAIPAPADDFEQQRQPLQRLHQAFEALKAEGFELDTLSMGMSDDMEAAIAEGSTIVRIGTDIFGARG